jgi:cell division protein FtsB
MPFILLLVGLLGGALVCLLVISTTLDTGAFQISSLQQQNSALATQQQELQQAVAKAKSTDAIAQRAKQLGMGPVGELRFINLKKRSVSTTAAHGAVVSAPGYTP